MTQHTFKPGDECLLDGKEVVTISEQSRHIKIKPTHLWVNASKPHDEIVGLSRLTSLIRAVVQKDGTVKEVNPLGDEPSQWGWIIPEQPDKRTIWNEWNEAGRNRRTWKYILEGLPGFGAIEYKYGINPMEIIEGATVLGYEKDRWFVIVKIEK